MSPSIWVMSLGLSVWLRRALSRFCASCVINGKQLVSMLSGEFNSHICLGEIGSLGVFENQDRRYERSELIIQCLPTGVLCHKYGGDIVILHH
jgi:hypothetical protein